MTAKPIVVRRSANRDVEIIRAWYENRQLGLGQRFVAAAIDRFREIERNPLAFAVLLGTIRACPVPGFPHIVYFRIRSTAIVVLAVAHGRRNPRAWKYRR